MRISDWSSDVCSSDLETGEGKFTQRIAAGRHVLAADEPESAGGLDLGLSPYDFLLAALGACTSMTLRLYAERKGIALERTRVTLSPEIGKRRAGKECVSTRRSRWSTYN